jgi:hypothetical protein
VARSPNGASAVVDCADAIDIPTTHAAATSGGYRIAAILANSSRGGGLAEMGSLNLAARGKS